MSYRILVMGLPGSGKTTFSKLLVMLLEKHFPDVGYYNAKEVRNIFEDWHFSELGRVRHSSRMKDLADHHEIAIADFVCPTKVTRKQYKADYTIWMNTINHSDFEDTNKIFEKPKKVNCEITNWDDNTTNILSIITELEEILNGKRAQ